MHLHHSIPYLHSSKFSHTFPLPQIHQLNSVSPPKRADLPGMSPNMTQQHAVRRGTNPHIKAELSQEQAKESGTPPFPLLGGPQKHLSWESAKTKFETVYQFFLKYFETVDKY